MRYVLGESDRICTLAARIYHQKYPLARETEIRAFEKLKQRFEVMGNVAYKKKTYQNKSVVNEDNELTVLLGVQENPHISVRQIGRQTGISDKSVSRTYH